MSVWNGFFRSPTIRPAGWLQEVGGDNVCDYLERARLYPTGRHCVDTLITPTLLTHQLLRSERGGIGFFSSSASSI